MRRIFAQLLIPGRRRVVAGRGEIGLNSQREGGLCRVYSPWASGIRVTDAAGKDVAVTADQYGRPEFATEPGTNYRILPK